MSNLNIDIDSYKLTNNHFHQIEYKKTQIVVGNTFNSGMNHYNGWLKRLNGNYTATANFTISVSGKIYQHFDPKYFSDYINIKGTNEYIISILLENEGWLEKNDAGDYITVCGNIFPSDSVIERRWRSQKYWAPYSNEQNESLIKLIRYLCDKYDIYLKTVGHNTQVESVLDYNGVLFKSNFAKEFTDVSPAFNFIEFKNNLELKNNDDE